MGKISLTSALNLFEEEKEIIKAIHFEEKIFQTPYWGLKCNRGLWLTRFPKGSLPEDPKFTMAYIKAGGGLDSMSHWGRNPEDLRKLEVEGWTYEQVALLGAGVPRYLCLYEGVTPQNFKTFERGLKRAEALKKMQVAFTCSVWTLGRVPIEKFLRKLFKNGIRVTGKLGWRNLEINHLLVYRPFYEGHYTVYGGQNTALEAVSEGDSGRRLYNLEEIFSTNFLQYCRKCVIEKNRVYVEQDMYPQEIFLSLKAARIYGRLAKIESWRNSSSIEGRSFGASQKIFRGEATTVGHVAQLHSGLLLRVVFGEKREVIISRTLHSIRQVGGYNVCKIDQTWFVWSTQGSFSEHFEGVGSLESILTTAAGRQKSDQLSLSLNMVRNDRSGTAGFCLPGTKNFLRAKMPFVYRLVEKYESWEEIPSDIMSTVWTLANKSIFQGYPSPVR